MHRSKYSKFHRPDFNRMIADMRAGEIDCIIVKDLSRLGRNYLEAGDYLEKIFPFFGIRFIAITDGYDSSCPNLTEDGLIVPLKNLINDIYAKDLSRKVSILIGEDVQESDSDDLKTISEKLEVINLQLAKRSMARVKTVRWILISLCALMVMVFGALIAINGSYMDWNYNDPELAVAETIMFLMRDY